MSAESIDPKPRSEPGPDAPVPRRPYEAPRLTYLGTLHAALHKTGPLFDFSLRRPARR
jgi:hypothetical protein